MHSLHHFYCESNNKGEGCFALVVSGNEHFKYAEIVLHTDSIDDCSDDDNDGFDPYEEGVAISVMKDFVECTEFEELVVKGKNLTSRSHAIAEECASCARRKVGVIIGDIDCTS